MSDKRAALQTIIGKLAKLIPLLDERQAGRSSQRRASNPKSAGLRRTRSSRSGDADLWGGEADC